ncbi:CpxP family protein [Vibrio sp. CAU 1672]|uniref:CpxP family protein n=1 Tax=Vibrio sp. CAU 1672 TaxID=3032594 RepID=UPI0023DAA059|nr:CpxP family protein [Vibrio sp. CAU 1672]MDF2154753.1 CpxP family protein [Vibrio sp. CAU 1672]
MKTVKKLVLATVALPLMLGTASAYAFGGKGHHFGPGEECGRGMERGLMRQLDLTDAQREQLQDLRSAHRAEMREQFAAGQGQRQAHHNRMQALMLADNFDQAEANALAQEMVDIQTERRVKMLERRHQMLSILTPEQKARFVELQNERWQDCGHNMQRRMEKRDNNG